MLLTYNNDSSIIIKLITPDYLSMYQYTSTFPTIRKLQYNSKTPLYVTSERSWWKIEGGHQTDAMFHSLWSHISVQNCSSSMECDALSWSAPAASALCCWMKKEAVSLSELRTSCCHSHWTTLPSRNTRLVRNTINQRTCTSVK